MQNRISIRLFLLLLALAGLTTVYAQSGNLLTNGGLEEPFRTLRGGEKPQYIANGWNLWVAPQGGPDINVPGEVVLQAHPGPGPVNQEGQRSQFIECAFIRCATALYQQVGNIQPNTSVTASAYSMLWTCNLGGGISCDSAVESGAQTRIGIDPTGGTDPNNPAIVWSAFVRPHRAGGAEPWTQQTVTATAQGATVTVFLYRTDGSKSDLNRTYWDNAVLSGTTGNNPGGTPGQPPPTPVPTSPPVVAFVVPQAAQDDGSIVHTVIAGDTIDSIAFAYGLTRVQLLELNPAIIDPRFINLGQKLLVRAATNAAAPETTPDPTASSAAATAPTAAEQPATNQPEPTAAAPEPTAVPVEPTQPPPPPTESGPQPTAPVVVAQAGGVDPASMLAQVCVLMFDDVNTNRLRDNGEALLPGGTIALARDGETVASHQTNGVDEPHCFTDLQSGAYIALAAAPEGFGLTSPDQRRVQANAGPAITLDFGAAQGVQPAQPPPADGGTPLTAETAPQTNPQSPLEQVLNVSGLVLFGLAGLALLGGIGLAFFLRRR
jgi:hypothetical protein